MLALITPDDLDEMQRQIDAEREAEVVRAPAKPFVHRESLSKCPSCRLALTTHGRRICEATGQTITMQSGTGQCAYLTNEVPHYDD